MQKHPDLDVFGGPGDVSDESFITDFVEDVVRQYGRLDYCVNSAGILGKDQSSTETTTEDFDKVNNVNYRGCWLTSRVQLKQMMKQEPLPSHDASRLPQRGSIVNIASQLGIVGRSKARKYIHRSDNGPGNPILILGFAQPPTLPPKPP